MDRITWGKFLEMVTFWKSKIKKNFDKVEYYFIVAVFLFASAIYSKFIFILHALLISFSGE